MQNINKSIIVKSVKKREESNLQNRIILIKSFDVHRQQRPNNTDYVYSDDQKIDSFIKTDG
jgi:hypothetical protein